MNTKSERFRHSILKILIILFTVTGLFVLLSGRNFPDVKLINKEPKAFDIGWYYYNIYGEKIVIPSFPCFVPSKNNVARIYHKLRAFEDGNTSLCFYSEHQNIVVRINDKKIYSFNTGTFPKNFMSYRAVYNLMHLPEITEDSILCIETESLVKSESGFQHKILLGDRSQIYFHIILEHIVNFLLGIIFIVSSIFLFCTNQLFSRSNLKDNTLLNLAVLTLCIGLWQLDDSNLLMFFTGYLPFLWVLKYLTQLFLPLACYFFIESIIEKPRSRFLRVIFWGIVAVVSIQFLLQILGIRALTETIFASHFIYVAICVYTVITLFQEEWLKESRLKYLLVFSMLFSVIIFTFTAISLLNNLFFSSVMSLGLAVTFIAMILIAYHKELKLFEAVSKADTYKKLAFIDIATGVSNKTAWFTLVENFNESTRMQGEYCLVVFDMNNLKKLNDNYGHLVGDKVIKSFCDTLIKVVNGKGQIFRLGGDEFVCVFSGIFRENVMTMLHTFEQEVSHQEENEYKFSAAYGYEFFTPKEPADFKIALEKADEKMYAAKVEMKAARE